MQLARANGVTSPKPYPYPNSFFVVALDDRSLRDGFGDRGLDLVKHFATRKERKRCNNGLEQEIFLLRRYLLTLSAYDRLAFPMTMSKDESPDFICCCNGVTFGIEVTEATCPTDQRDMTLRQEKKGAHLIGALDGRFGGGAYGTEPERACVDDVLTAVRRKVRKIVEGKYDKPGDNLKWFDLLIYPSGNASFYAHSDEVMERLSQSLSVEFWRSPDVSRVRSISAMFRSQLAYCNRSGLLKLPLHK
ncbi:MAG: hypothetical protein V3V97_09425 [Hyphomicrobiaceae bacterium]